MKKLLISAAFSLLAAGVASAADMPVRGGRAVAPQPLPPAEASWAGWYMGLNAGGAWGSVNVDYATPFESVSRSPRTTGFTGGVQVGYNWQSGMWVYGLETDLNVRDASQDWALFLFGSHPTAGNPFGSVAGDNTAIHVEQNWFGTFRGRLGFVASNWLFYGTGGLAYGGVEHTVTETLVAPNASVFRTATVSGTRVGYAFGGGVQGAIGGGWRAGVEYLYVNLGTWTLNQPASTNLVVFPADTTRFRDRANIVRFTLNYPLGTGAH